MGRRKPAGCSAILFGEQVTTERPANAYVHPRTGRQGDWKSQIQHIGSHQRWNDFSQEERGRVLHHRSGRAAQGLSARIVPEQCGRTPIGRFRTGGLRYDTGVLKGELNQLRERLADIDTQHDRERRVLSDQIEDLRKRLDQAEQERREKDRQLTALLSDQRQKAQEPGAAPQRAGFLGRFLGRRG